MAELFLRHVEVDGRAVDVRVTEAAITEIGPGLRPGRDAHVVDGAGGALLPGLHDHHLHLLATAAARASLDVGPAAVGNSAGLAASLRRTDQAMASGQWIRAVGYHEAVAGDLDRTALDRLVPHRPTRVQHRTGARWILNSAAIGALALEEREDPGIERDSDGRPTGRLHRADRWLRDLLPQDGAPDLADLGAALASVGVTGVTDATPVPRLADLAPLADAVAIGALPQRVMVMTDAGLGGDPLPDDLVRGPVKVVIDDGDYPSLDALADQIDRAHRHHLPVAIHCVTCTSLVLALAAWQAVGSHAGDRIEHGSVIPPELHEPIAELDLTVVTQPGFVAERGDQYLTDVDPDDVPHLYPCRSLLDAGIPVAASSDAPYTHIDPWAAMRAAVDRTTASGAVIGPDQAVSPERALQLFLGPPDQPGGSPRTVAVGAPADLCLLAIPLEVALRNLSSDDVAAAIMQGTLR